MSGLRKRSEFSEQQQNKQDNEHQSQPSAGIVTPPGAVWPRGQRGHEQHNHQEENQRGNRHALEIV